MPGTVVGLSMNYGFAGTPARTPDLIIASKPVKDATDDIPFGAPVQMNSDNTVELGGANLTPDNFAGVAVAEVKQQTVYPTVTEDGGVYKANQACDYIQRGIVTVKKGWGPAPTSGGKVYVRTATSVNYPGSAVGDFGTVDDGNDAIELPNAVWNTNKVDANNITELKLLTINI